MGGTLVRSVPCLWLADVQGVLVLVLTCSACAVHVLVLTRSGCAVLVLVLTCSAWAVHVLVLMCSACAMHVLCCRAPPGLRQRVMYRVVYYVMCIVHVSAGW